MFNQIKSSFYNPSFYRSIDGSKIKSAFVYYLKLNLIVAVVIAAILSIGLIPKILDLTKKSNIESVLSGFPKDFEITIKDGIATSNSNEPYVVAFPNDISSKKSGFDKNPANLILVDTNSDFSLDKLRDSQSAFYLSKDYLVYQDERGKLSVEPIKDLPDFVINQSSIMSMVNKFLPYVYIFFALLPLFFCFAFFIMSFIANLIFIAIMSLIIMLVLKLNKISTSYKSLFNIGLYVITPLVLFDLFFSFVLGVNIPLYVSFIVYLSVYYINTRKVISK